jgi:hypothetical protein
VSSDHGPGAPSFGDLFEDPDSPVAPPHEPVAPRTTPEQAVEPVAEPVADPVVEPLEAPADEQSPEPVAAVLVATGAAADHASHVATDRAAHDLDHESAEASHLVAGFEHDDEPGVVVPPAPGPAPDSAEVAAPVVVAAAASAPWDGTVDPAVSSAPAGRVDTGRLYRSAGAEGPSTLDAIPAIDPARMPARPSPVVDEPVAPVRRADRGLTYSGAVVVIGASTVLVAFAEALLRHEIGWLTGVALLVSSVYAALVVRLADIWAAVVIPPLAFLVAVLTAGQLTILGKTGGLLVREGALLFVSLATNAPWILGTTLVCLVIVLVRRHRARTA